MTIAAHKDHVCPPDRIPIPYIVAITDGETSNVMVKQNSDGSLCFPRVHCPEIPSYGKKVCECIGQRLEKMCGTRYELILLYSTINDFQNTHIRPIFSNFYCLSPNDKSTGMPVAPAFEEYKWMATSEVNEIINCVGEEGCRWINDTKDYETFVFLTRDNVFEKGEDEEGLQPWEVPGWFTNTTSAAIDTLTKLGYEIQAPFEQFQMSHRNGSVLRANTNRGKVYLKASDRIEGKVTSLVSSFAPQLVRKPIFVNEEKRWMLMSDQGMPADEKTMQEQFARLLAKHGKLQVQSLQHINELKDFGLPVRSSDSLIQQTRTMLADKHVLEKLAQCEAFRNRAKEDVADISVYETALYDLLQEFYDSGKCPLTLTHCDMSDNVLKADDGTLVLYDWGEAKIDIPLCDTLFFYGVATPVVIDEYLSLWENYAPASYLRKLLEIVPLHGCLVFVLEGYDGRITDEDAQNLGRILVNAKELADENIFME